MKNPILRIASTVAFASLALALSACQTTRQKGHAHSFSFDPPDRAPKNPSAVKVKISTGAQRLYVVEGNDVLIATPVTVGKASSPTPQGDFTIYSKQAHRRRVSQPDAGYPMTYWMEFKPAYGIHWGFVKPSPATHGCVRMPLIAAKEVFAVVPKGAPLNIAKSQPWDETIGKTLPVLDDGPLPNPPKSYLMSPQVFADAAKGKMWNF
ncbi:MAG: L,D-transpeptidase [Verrucomicrobiota bacterium]